jgi:hypothetical protein
MLLYVTLPEDRRMLDTVWCGDTFTERDDEISVPSACTALTVRRWLPSDMATDKSSGVTGINWRISTLSTKTLTELRGAVDEKSATTRTGELTTPAPGETIFTRCARLIVAPNRDTESVTLRAKFADDKTTSEIVGLLWGSPY